MGGGTELDVKIPNPSDSAGDGARLDKAGNRKFQSKVSASAPETLVSAVLNDEVDR